MSWNRCQPLLGVPTLNSPFLLAQLLYICNTGSILGMLLVTCISAQWEEGKNLFMAVVYTTWDGALVRKAGQS